MAGTYKVNKNAPYSWTVENPVKKEAEVAGTIQGYKFNDLDRDGVWDEGEAGLEGWTITLWKYLGDMDESGNLSVADVENMGTAVTDVNGMYQFTNLEDGARYYLSENIASMPYWYQTYPVTGPELAGTGKMNIVESVKNGDEITNVNFGNYYYKPSDGGGGNENPDNPGGGASSGGGRSGGGTTVRITPGGGTSQPIAIEAFGPGEEEFITLDMPVFSSEEEPEEIATAAFLEQAVMSAGPDDNPQTSDAGFAMQMQMLGLSMAAMFVLRKKIK